LDLHDGKITFLTFCRELLRDQKKVLGWYDAAMMTEDPFPATANFEGIDPTLAGLNRVYTAGANAHIRDNLGVRSERKYELLNFEVNEKWQWRNEASGEAVPPGATDDMAAGLSMNPDMKLIIVHGLYDLVTPYFTSKFFAMHLARKSAPASKIELKNYEGGHMFYMWEKSRKAFFKDIKALYTR
jgi:carboxypeptidase C (cathepsin A)